MRRISTVAGGSPASRHRLSPGDILLSINGEPVLDEIDYQALTARRRLHILLQSPEGIQREVDLIKGEATPLGLQFDDSIIGNPRTCGNQCVFCFVEQMPKGMRESLYLKDDDWRLSLLMGNYITLTNVGNREFERIIRRRAAPLYISVHATDADLRAKILGNKRGALLMDRLRRLKEEGLSFHCQLVLCPGLNDGEALKQSLNDLLDLSPAALSVAVVPVGLTRHREGLPPIRPYTREEALEVLDITSAFQKSALARAGTRFAFPADEFLCIAGVSLPPRTDYENYPQLENGVGMLRHFEEELKEAAGFYRGSERADSKILLLPCGAAVAPFLSDWIRDYAPPGVNAQVVPVVNRFFGKSVTVTGLICAQDLIVQLKGRQADAVLIADTMLNSDNTLFLDGAAPGDVQEALGIPVVVFHNNGSDFFHALAASIPPVVNQEAKNP